MSLWCLVLFLYIIIDVLESFAGVCKNIEHFLFFSIHTLKGILK